MNNGISELRVYEQDLIKDRHYILYGGSGGRKIETEIGRLTFKYNYITLKMQFEIDKLKSKIVLLEIDNKFLKTQKK